MRASYVDGANTPEFVDSTPTASVLNVNDLPTGTVSISGATGAGGAPQQGDTLAASNTLADLDGMGTVSYQWFANGVIISGATAASFTLAQAQVGQTISVRGPPRRW